MRDSVVDAADRADARAAPSAASPLEHVVQVLATCAAPVPRLPLRPVCHMRDTALSDVLGQLPTAGRVAKSAAGYELAAR
jgi:hypothetical protein